MLENVNSRVENLKKTYALATHVEGGSFSKVYASPFAQSGRKTTGSIYFLLSGAEVSHFHQIDCDELWYYHEGGGLKIYVIKGGALETFLLGKNLEQGQRAMVLIPAGAIFAAENLDRDSYTFVSCATTPEFSYDGFKLISRDELQKIYPQAPEKILRLAYSEDLT